MSFKAALRTRLLAAEELAGVSIEWSRRKAGVYPAIVLTIVSDRIGRHMTGLDGWRQPRVQIDVMSIERAMVESLHEWVLATIAPAALIDGVRFGRAQQMRVTDMGEEAPTGFVFRDMIEAVLPHKLET